MKRDNFWAENSNILNSCNGFDEVEMQFYSHLRKSAPRTVYKYMYIKNEDIQERVMQLEKGKIWFSKRSKLNDPNDLIIGRLEDADSLSYYLDVCKQTEIACFTTNPKNKLMWSHYAHGYEGICVSYNVDNPGYLLPIIYVNRRPDFTKEYKEFLSRKKEVEVLGKYYTEDKELTKRTYGINQLSFLKEKVWSYEKEYRAIRSCEIGNEDLEGSLNDLEEIGLKISKIYYGFRCDSKLIAELEKMRRREYDDRLMKLASWSKMENNDQFITFLKRMERPIELFEIYYDDNLKLKHRRNKTDD